MAAVTTRQSENALNGISKVTAVATRESELLLAKYHRQLWL